MTSPMVNRSRRILKTAGALVLLLFFALYFWHCPIYAVIGLPCPGCNFRSAAFALLRGNAGQSLYYHAMLIPTVIFLILGFFLPSRRKTLLWLWAAGMMIYYGFRMLFLFNQPPMLLNWNAPLLRLLLLLRG